MVIINKTRIPIKIWADDAHIINYSNAITQAENLANHPLTEKWVCLMPDFHVGFGMPIGGVVVTKGGVIPNAVGVDIGCGMIALKTALVTSQTPSAVLSQLTQEIHQRVPCGGGSKEGHHTQKQNHPFLAASSLSSNTFAQLPWIKPAFFQEADYAIGTLGGGNHFIEIQKDEADTIWIMIHSGSRNVGKKICDHYHNIALKYMEQFHSQIPSKDLAFLPEGVPEYDEYLLAMNWAMQFAEFNRELMLKKVIEAFDAVGLKTKSTLRIETHHNFAAMENHFNQNVLVHRKGAVKAEGLVTIPGSMGTASYICQGLKPTESFNSCSHGAGRVLGRRQANESITHEQAVESMKHVVFGVRQGDYDEMPAAYKDIDWVIEQQKDLVKPVYKLLPLAVVKG